jgi:hypothetical protein
MLCEFSVWAGNNRMEAQTVHQDVETTRQTNQVQSNKIDRTNLDFDTWGIHLYAKICGRDSKMNAKARLRKAQILLTATKRGADA